MPILKAAGVTLTSVVIAASAWMNFDYMTGEGTGHAAVVLGVISVAFDLIKALLPVMIAAAIGQGAWMRAGGASFFLVLLVAFGFVSALGFGENSKGNRATTREGLAAELLDAERDQLTARARLQDLPVARPAGVIAAELALHKKDRLWDSSKGCTAATAPASRELCKSIERLNSEAANAVEAQVIGQKVERLAVEIRRLRERGAGREADPQASALRRILGPLLPSTDAAVIRSGVVWLFATLVEGWSAFGLYLCGVRHPERTGRRANLQKEGVVAAEPLMTEATLAIAPPVPIEAEDGRLLRMAAWALSRLEFTEGGIVGLDTAWLDYQRVAADSGKDTLPEREFRKALIAAVLELDCQVRGEELRGVELANPRSSITSAEVLLALTEVERGPYGHVRSRLEG